MLTNAKNERMIKWNDYYQRSAYIEGFVSSFDLFGESSSFDHSINAMSEDEYIRHTIGRSFSEVDRFLKTAIRDFVIQYDKTKENKS